MTRAQQCPACQGFALLHAHDNSDKYFMTDQEVQYMMTILRIC
jgi:hypothetical protein